VETIISSADKYPFLLPISHVQPIIQLKKKKKKIQEVLVAQLLVIKLTPKKRGGFWRT
jgi:hypothetical protein